MEIRTNSLVIIKKNNLLLSQKGVDQKSGEIFYRLLGGGIEFGEHSRETLTREIKEELNATIINEKFLCVIENVFEFNFKKYHEITFLYSGDLLEKNLYNEINIKIFDKDDKYTDWVSIDEIKSGRVIIYPKETIKYL